MVQLGSGKSTLANTLFGEEDKFQTSDNSVRNVRDINIQSMFDINDQHFIFQVFLYPDLSKCSIQIVR